MKSIITILFLFFSITSYCQISRPFYNTINDTDTYKTNLLNSNEIVLYCGNIVRTGYNKVTFDSNKIEVKFIETSKEIIKYNKPTYILTK